MSECSYVVKYGPDNLPLWQKTKQSFLGNHQIIELTERCNNNCLHCNINRPADDASAKARELTTDEWKHIFRQIAELGILSVCFTGGEPLLRDDFPELYLFARKQGLMVLIFTNGRLITPQLADLLARIPPLEPIEISVYGMRRKSYEAVTRAPGSYAEFRRGIDLLLERKIPFIVKGALLPPNRGEMEEFKAWAKTIPWMDAPPAYSMFFDLRCRRDSKTRNRLISGLRISPDEGLSILAREKRFREEMVKFCARFMRPAGDRLFTCGAGHGGCIDAYGKFQVCMLVRHPDLVYALKKGSLKDALKVMLPRLRPMRAANSRYLERCARCFLHGLCEQCPGTSWSEHGTLDTPVEYFCRVAHAQALWLGLLARGEKAWMVKDWKERIMAIAKVNRL